MAVVSMKALLESGVHFGHRTNKWNPRMKPYIFTERNGIHIIDLQQTSKLLNQAYNLVRDVVADGGTILFVGTKRQAQETIVDEANRCGMPYVSERWLGGTLTNWPTIHARVQEMIRLEKMRDNGELEHLTKKEGLLIERDIARLQMRLEGLRTMKKRPELVFIVDIGREDSAVKDANLLNIPIVALVDTNCNPQNIDYVIPSNDDAIRAIKLLVGKIADAVLEGKAMRKEEEDVDEAAGAATTDDGERKPVRVVEMEEEVEDEELLGEATLAKMNAAAEEEEKKAAAEASDVEEAASEEPEAEESDSTSAEGTSSEEAGSTESESEEADATDAEETSSEEAGSTEPESEETDSADAAETNSEEESSSTEAEESDEEAESKE